MKPFLLLSLLYGNFLFLSIIPVSVFCQDNEADKILEASRLASYLTKDFSADLIYEIKTPAYHPTRKQGSFRYQLYRNQYRYAVKFEDQWMISDGNILWVYFPNTNELATFATEDWAHENILSMIRLLYTQPSELQYEGLDKIGGRTCHKLSFVMRNRSLSFYKAYMWIGQTNYLVNKVLFLNRQRSQSLYEFSNIRVNSGIDDRVFQFNPADYPGIKEREDK